MKTRLERRVSLGGVEREVEHAEEGGEGVLVHRVDGGEAREDEKERRAAARHRRVLGAHRLELRGGGPRLRQLLRDLHRLGLGVLERLDELGVVEDVPLRAAQLPQQRVLERLEQLLVAAHLRHQRLPRLLQVRPLVPHRHVQQLRLEPRGREPVVDDAALPGDLRAVVRVRQLARQVQAERWVPVHLLVPELHHGGAAGRRHLEHRVDDRVDVLVDVLEEEREAVLDGELELLEKVAVVEGAAAALERLALAALDPRHRLLLRVDAQREARRPGGEDAVLHRQLVHRQALRRPVARLHVVREQVLRMRRGRGSSAGEQ